MGVCVYQGNKQRAAHLCVIDGAAGEDCIYPQMCHFIETIPLDADRYSLMIYSFHLSLLQNR